MPDQLQQTFTDSYHEAGRCKLVIHPATVHCQKCLDRHSCGGYGQCPAHQSVLHACHLCAGVAGALFSRSNSLCNESCFHLGYPHCHLVCLHLHQQIFEDESRRFISPLMFKLNRQNSLWTKKVLLLIKPTSYCLP